MAIAAGFNAEGVWARLDLCVIVADSPSAAAWRRSMACSTSSTAVSLNLPHTGVRPKRSGRQSTSAAARHDDLEVLCGRDQAWLGVVTRS